MTALLLLAGGLLAQTKPAAPAPLLTRVLFKSSDPVLAVAAAPDGKRVVAAGLSKKLHLIDRAAGREEKAVADHGQEIAALALLADGAVAMTATGDGVVRLWELPGGRELRNVGRHPKRLFALEPIPGVGRAAAPGQDGQVALLTAVAAGEPKLFPWEAGKPTPALAENRGCLLCAAVSPGARWLAAAGADRRITLIDLTTGTPRPELVGHADAVYCLLFLDDDTLLSAGKDRTVRRWDVRSGVVRRQHDGGPGYVQGLGVLAAPDGSKLLVAGGHDGTVVVLDERTGAERGRQKLSAAVHALAPLSKPAGLVAGLADGTVVELTAAGGRPGGRRP